MRNELHMFGFRPNLTRRPENTRWYVDETGRWNYTDTESIANDVAIHYPAVSKLTKVPELNLFTLHFLSLASSTSTPLAEYLLSAVAYGKDTTRLMQEALKQFHQNAGNWGANELINVCMLVSQLFSNL